MAILLVPTWNKSLIKSSNRPPLFLAAQRVLFLAAQGALFLGAQRAHKPWCSAPTLVKFRLSLPKIELRTIWLGKQRLHHHCARNGFREGQVPLHDQDLGFQPLWCLETVEQHAKKHEAD